MKKPIFISTILICFAIIILIAFSFRCRKVNTNDNSANNKSTKTYNYSIETEEFGTVYIHGQVPKRSEEISEEEAVVIANKEFTDKGYLNSGNDGTYTLVYHLNYLDMISSEYSMWAVFAEIDGKNKYECMINVKTGNIDACFLMDKE
ncbi:hypothetical protein [Anaeromicropila herbilytica]|uniref:Uncharacterized protein n=1 Tax=Anaeromicropila herbilytica TaxID=2785025 RepID=A0A7R7EN40_9FIRM|nr:hypothetical protein [Anaeromicropila herbilytica]BCN31905.1 hypothetical protein bsdtb5_32000 [Anaeromicropila herbilytica]